MISPWEILAVILALAYLGLAIRQSSWCWPAAIASTSIYIFLMYGAGLYMESALQVFYIVIAVYGWRQWTRGAASPLPAESGTGPAAATLHMADDPARTGRRIPLQVSTWPWNYHAVAVAAIALASAVSGELLARFTDAAFPYADSFTTWGAIVTTWMVARKILENWIYWFVIDSVCVFLYFSRELYLTAGLFVIYLILVVAGYQAWLASMRSTQQVQAQGAGAGSATSQ